MNFENKNPAALVCEWKKCVKVSAASFYTAPTTENLLKNI